MSNLFIFTIGPVQGLIANSRKLRDMRAGSELLSTITAEAIAWLKDYNNGQIKIIFPVLEDKESSSRASSPNIPNRLIAEFPDWSDAALTSAAWALTAHIRGYFLELTVGILQDSGVSAAGLAMARQQLKDFLEIYWLFTPYDGKSYAAAYERLFHDINAVKNIRPFAQSTEPWGRKCALFPQYNAIFARRSSGGYLNSRHVYDLSQDTAFHQPQALKPNEALSAIALVKRLYPSAASSIYSLRLMMLASRLPDDLLHDARLATDRDNISNVIYDLLNDNRPEEYLPETIDLASSLYQELQKRGVVLSSYYALIKFDGDSMGDRFRSLQSSAEQLHLSQSLSKFANIAPDILRKWKGLPIYAGGEDFLGFVPLDHLFAALTELDCAFQTNTGLTFSAGIAIAHLMQPLKDVVAEADRQERTAKALTQKHAFAIGLLKRGGEFVALPAYHLSSKNSDEPALKNVEQLVAALQAAQYSKSLFYHISTLLGQLDNGQTPPAPDLVKVLLSDLIQGAEVASPAAADELQKQLVLFYTYCVEQSQADCLQAFLNTLNAAVFIAREVL